MKNRYKNVFFLLLSVLKVEAVCDLMVSGPLDFCDGLGKIAYGIIDQVSDVLDVRYHTGSFCLFSDDPYNVMSRTKKEKDAKGSGIFLYSNGIVAGIQDDSYLFESKDTVKIAYSMFEATEIPQEWVKQLNNHFDAAIVPDIYHVDVYKNSGVLIPLFVIPTGLYLEEYLNLPDKKEASKPFVFGCASTNTHRKNLKRTIDAFIKRYGNKPDYKLQMHVKYPLFVEELLEDYIEDKGITNIEITSELLNEEEFTNFIHNLDCYMLLSMGEGFSNTPREALASGIPVIISDNTAQSTICASGHVTSVPSTQEVDAWYEALNRSVGKQFDCKQEDVIAAMEYVVNNYSDCLGQAQKGKEWVRQYEWKNVKSSFLALFDPQSVELGEENFVDPAAQKIITTDENFYNKMNAFKKIKQKRSSYSIKSIPVDHIESYYFKTLGAGLCSTLNTVKSFKEEEWLSFLDGEIDLDDIKESASLNFLIEGKYKHVIVALAKEWDLHYHKKESLLYDVIYCYTEEELFQILDSLPKKEFVFVCEEFFSFMNHVYKSLPKSANTLLDTATFYANTQEISNLL